ncbi:VOC family protein [Gordonia sinesedis]
MNEHTGSGDTHDNTEYGAIAPGDPLAILRVADMPGWSDPIDPDPDFARTLRDRLERGATLPEGITMSDTVIDTESTVTTTPSASTVERPGVLPYLTVDDGHAAIDWYVAHLGARLRGTPIVMEDNRIGHAELEIGGGAIYLADAFPDMGLTGPAPGQVSVSLMLAVDDTDAAVAEAARGGAAVTREPYEAYGARTGTVVDPFGHRWMLTGPSTTSATDAAAPDKVRAGDIVYLSLQTPDIDRAVRFYSSVLGWEYDPDSRQVTNLGQRLGLFDGGGYGSNTVYCVYAVDDLDAARAAIVAAGGTAGDVSTVARDGYRVLDAVDAQGVAFSVHVPDPSTPRPAQHPRGPGEMAYLTVHTPDSSQFRDFYSAVLGWTFRPGHVEDGWEVEDMHPQVGFAGGAAEPSTAPMWSVTDIDAAVERVRAAGGRVLDEPSRQPYGISARCVDDQGAEFYLGQLF